MTWNVLTWQEKLARIGRSTWDGLLQLIYPPVCLMCARRTEAAGLPFCTDCQTALSADEHHRCRRCAATVGPFVSTETGCTRCHDEVYAFDSVLRLGPYDGALREAVLRMKHGSGEMLAECLGLLWGRSREAELRSAAADVVVPVPLHWWRRWTRSYNQCDALGYSLAATLGLPCRPRWLRRVRATTPQTRLTPAQRLVNLRKVFRARGELQGKCVLLIDDVLTSGSTASEAAAALKRQGAARVVVAVAARSHP
jgi:ComF family protein